jgi:mRNA-degrading endonuclease toxin of MazEF toxin-antitoxin module
MVRQPTWPSNAPPTDLLSALVPQQRRQPGPHLVDHFGQAGRRAALVLTPRIYNAKSGLALACPITNQAKGYPFEVAVPAGHAATGVILADHVKSVDWKARRAAKRKEGTPIGANLTVGTALWRIAYLFWR